MEVQHTQEQEASVPQGLIDAVIGALTNPQPSPERVQDSRVNRWEIAVREVREYEAALEAVRKKFLDHRPVSSLVRRIVASEYCEAKRGLLEVEAPHVEGLKLKMAAFMDLEGENLDGPPLKALEALFADVERLLPSSR